LSLAADHIPNESQSLERRVQIRQTRLIRIR
jgi:hypothetical protein